MGFFGSSTLSQPLRGIIKKYNGEKRYGFIQLDVPRTDRRDIFFFLGKCNNIGESYPGEIELVFDTDIDDIDREPWINDRVVVVVQEREKGPFAFQWTYEDIWNDGLTVIETRPEPNEIYCHIIDGGNDQNCYRKSLVWGGWHSDLVRYLDKVTPDLGSQSSLYIEELLAEGWRRMYHPSGWHPKYKCTRDQAEVDVEEVVIDRMTEEELLRGLEGLAPQD